MTPALRHKTDPGIVFIDNDSAARVLHYGEDGLERRPPAGIARERETRVDDAVPNRREHRAPASPNGCAGGPDRESSPGSVDGS